MFATLIATFVVIGILFAAMAVGVIFSNKPIKGSCGGLATLGMKDGCEICGGDRDACEENTRQESAKRAGTLGKDVLKT
ncbi:(Na+)-NQR maturation NqrM [Alcanivorax sp. 24]|uniref:(Na+)-NQR maturation NqrM n=1 Tax=Alcanivorax sp. 24 TaxID=2545266 RepID=UPI00105CF4E9|nr:(Na+)-NQR maturation NqrM [Alcanivorax sp. 24]